jgi:hypothetical protein
MPPNLQIQNSKPILRTDIRKSSRGAAFSRSVGEEEARSYSEQPKPSVRGRTGTASTTIR